jgi:hypothetical protein
MKTLLFAFALGVVFGFSAAVVLFRWLNNAPLVPDRELTDEKFFEDKP